MEPATWNYLEFTVINYLEFKRDLNKSLFYKKFDFFQFDESVI